MGGLGLFGRRGPQLLPKLSLYGERSLAELRLDSDNLLPQLAFHIDHSLADLRVALLEDLQVILERPRPLRRTSRDQGDRRIVGDLTLQNRSEEFAEDVLDRDDERSDEVPVRYEGHALDIVVGIEVGEIGGGRAVVERRDGALGCQMILDSTPSLDALPHPLPELLYTDLLSLTHQLPLSAAKAPRYLDLDPTIPARLTRAVYPMETPRKAGDPLAKAAHVGGHA